MDRSLRGTHLYFVIIVPLSTLNEPQSFTNCTLNQFRESHPTQAMPVPLLADHASWQPPIEPAIKSKTVLIRNRFAIQQQPVQTHPPMFGVGLDEFQVELVTGRIVLEMP